MNIPWTLEYYAAGKKKEAALQVLPWNDAQGMYFYDEMNEAFKGK